MTQMRRGTIDLGTETSRAALDQPSGIDLAQDVIRRNTLQLTPASRLQPKDQSWPGCKARIRTFVAIHLRRTELMCRSK